MEEDIKEILTALDNTTKEQLDKAIANADKEWSEMEMEEELKVLEEYTEKDIPCDSCRYCSERPKVSKAVRNLIARYKEVEDKNKTLETLLQGNLYQMYLYYKELAGRYQANSISKDKVKEKIEELKKYGNNLTEEQRQKETEFLQGKLKAYEELLED